jgi:rubredoxin
MPGTPPPPSWAASLPRAGASTPELLERMTAFVPGGAGAAVDASAFARRQAAAAAALAGDAAWRGCPVHRPVRHTAAAAPAAATETRTLMRSGGGAVGGGGRRTTATGDDDASGPAVAARDARPRARVVGVVGKISFSKEVRVTEELVPVPPEGRGGGLFGVKAKAYWESMGVLPLSFAAFGIAALVIKLAKVKKGQWKAGEGGINRATTHASIVTSEEEEAELHVFKCSGCGYEIYPARGREFKFFPDSFKCPLCATPKADFWDLNDPTDPRNQESDDEQDDGEADDDSDTGGPGPSPGTGVPTVVVEASDASPNA